MTIVIIDRLNGLAEQLQRLSDNYWIRTEGETIFVGARNELADIIRTYSEPVAPPPAIINQVMQPGDLDALVVSIVDRIKAMSTDQLKQLQGVIVGEIVKEAEKSDVSVLDALAQTREELLAAVAPATT